MIQAIIGNLDDCYPKLKPFYNIEVSRGNLEITGYASINKISFLWNKNLMR